MKGYEMKGYFMCGKCGSQYRAVLSAIVCPKCKSAYVAKGEVSNVKPTWWKE